MRTDGQMGRHGEANSRFSPFCERAQKLVKTCQLFLHLFNDIYQLKQSTCQALPLSFSRGKPIHHKQSSGDRAETVQTLFKVHRKCY